MEAAMITILTWFGQGFFWVLGGGLMWGVWRRLGWV